jgi:hypothetical protein
MKRILLVVAMMFSSGAFAYCEITNTGLPDHVVQKLRTDCEALRLDQLNKEVEQDAVKKAAKIVEKEAPMITPEKLTSWATVAEGFARAVGAAAKEIGVSVNEFITTPAGIITMAFIILKAFGAGMMKILVIIFLTVVTYWINRHIWTQETIEVPKSLFGMGWSKTKRKFYTFKEIPDIGGWISIVGTFIYLFASTTILLSIG